MDKVRKIFCLLLLALFFPNIALAYQLQTLSDTKVYSDFVLNPGKIEVNLNPGGKITKELQILNRSGFPIDFKVTLEDIGYQQQDSSNSLPLSSASNPYSLKDYLKPEMTEFTLQHGEQLTLPVLITIPQDSVAGGLYATVGVSGKIQDQILNSNGFIKPESKISSVFFVRVSGRAEEAGRLESFNSVKSIYFGSPIAFNLNFKNEGDVYLNPKGELKIRNLLGQEVFRKDLSGYYIMPNSEKTYQEIWDGRPFGGIYQATVKVNRGYGNLADQQSVYFAVITVKFIIALIFFLILISWVAYKLYTADK